MNPPVHRDTFFPYVHLSLERIIVDEIDSIPDWITYLTGLQEYYQIDMDASHPLLPSIISTLLTSIVDNEHLSYIHIKQSKKRHFFTPTLLQPLIHVVRENHKHPNITIQVTYHNRVEYH